MKQFKRSERVRLQMLRDIQSILEPECSVNLDAMVTFTDVKLSGDLRFATVYYSVLGNDSQKEKAAGYLSRITKRVQSQLGQLLSIRYTPILNFKFDSSIEHGLKIQKLLNNISKNKDDE